ncbi:hypothetical protein MJM04_31070, partial [Salmonella enterica subsp. enterica serovar Cerro]|nr:hypothetical protein [Salmonella enterica subsp. enterica serovar Cerro]
LLLSLAAVLSLVIGAKPLPAAVVLEAFTGVCQSADCTIVLDAMACMKGRGHFYEGRGMAVMTDAIRTLKLLGCEVLFCTNAAGSL